MQERQSRLNRATAQETKKQITFFIIAIIILIFVAFQFGPGILNLIAQFTGSKTTINNITNEENTLEAPFIDSIPEATDSAVINISGSSTYSDAQVELYVNDDLSDTTPLSADQKFTFTNVRLTEGQNIIKARVKKGSETSTYTRSYYVSYSQGTPKLEITSPSDNQEFKRGDQTIIVQGTTDPENIVTVNGFRAIVDSSGNFTYNLNLSEGDNNLEIKAQNKSGKTTDKKIKVSFRP